MKTKMKLFSLASALMLSVALASCGSYHHTTMVQEGAVLVEEGEWHTCTVCEGKGSCTDCAGTGKVGSSKCKSCKGSGRCNNCDGKGGYYAK